MTPVSTSEPLYTLRDYQIEAVAAWRAGLDNWNGGPWPAIVSPTGSGKTVMFSALARDELGRGGRVLIATHTEKLAKQAAEKARDMVPGARVGIVQGEHNDHRGRDIVVGMVPTLAHAKRREQISGITLGIADECHHAPAPTWRTVMGHYADRGAKWVGATATMARQSNNVLGDIWDVVYQRDITEAIADGSIVSPRGIRVQVASLELEDVKRSRGDMQAEDLGAAMMDADAGDAIARAMLEHGPQRRWAVFAPTVATAYQFAQDIRAAGITCETIEGRLDEDERAAIYARYQSGQTQTLTNCMVLTEGWDAPWCDGIVMARPTESAPLYVQIVGRGLRPFPAGGKTDCLVLDMVGATAMHRLATLADLSTSVEKVLDGESLAEAIDREAKAREDTGPAPAGEHFTASGELVSTVVELFANTRTVWLKTRRGIWFIPTKAGEFFIAPAHEPHNAGLFYLGQAHTEKGWHGKTTFSRVRPEPMGLDAAMAWAERYAREAESGLRGHVLSNADAGWRVRSDPPTQAQLLELAPLIPATKAEAADLIAIKFASTRLDRIFSPKSRTPVKV